MEGSTGRQPRVLRVEQGFECSRLDNALLASAYQHVVPSVRCQVGRHDADAEQDHKNICLSQQLIAKGA
jgi:hypothetical protein